MAKDRIQQKDVLDDKVIKSFSDLNKEMLQSVKIMTDLSETAINLNKSFDPKSMQDVITSQEQYNKVNQESQTENQKAAETLKKLEDKIEAVNKEEERLKLQLQAKRKEVKANIKAEKDEANSINALSKRIKELREASKRVNTTTKEGRSRISAYNKEINKLNAQITASSDDFTKSKRNIGNYTSALSTLPGGFGRAVSGAQGFAGALKSLSAIPIVLFLVAIVGAIKGLVSLFKSTDDGATRLEATMNGLKAVFGVLKGVILDVIEGTKARFERFAKQWELLKERIKGNDERVAEIRKEIEALNQTIQGNNPFQNIGERAREAYNEVFNLTFQMDALNDRIIGSISSQKQLEIQMEEFIKQSKDQTKSEEERIALLEKGMAKAKEFYGNQRQFALETFEAEIEMEAAKREVSAETLRELILMDGKAAESARQTNDEMAKAWNEAGDDRIKQLEEFYVQALEADLQYTKKTKELTSLLTGLQRKATEDKIEIKQTENEDILALMDEQFEAEIEKFAEQLDIENETELEKLEELNEARAEKYQEDAENAKAADELKKESTKQWVSYATSQAQQLSNSIFGFIQAELDYQLQADIEKARSRGASEDEIARIEKDAAQKRKSVRLTQAIINTALGVTNALATASSWIEGIIAAVLVGAMGALEIATISSASFAKGTHDSGSGWIDATVAEKGREKIILADGTSFYTPDSQSKMLLPPHSQVIPNDVLQRELAENQYYLRENREKEERDWQKELIDTIKNKKETNLNITENGVSVTAKKGNTFYKYLDRKYRD